VRKYETKSKCINQDYLIEISCDLCGRKAKNENWDASSYEINETEIEVTVRYKNGSVHPGGGWGTNLIVDICPKCFKDELIPFLESKGTKIEEREWEF